MELKDAMNDYKFEQDGEDARGYYFTLTDAQEGNDYKVILTKDTGEIMPLPSYNKTIPRDAFEAARMRINYFKTLKKVTVGNKGA